MIRAAFAGVVGVGVGILALHAAVPVPRAATPAPPAVMPAMLGPSRPLQLAVDAIQVRDEAVYVLARDLDEGRTPLHVVAIDRATLAVKWRSRGLPALAARPGARSDLGALESFGADVIVRDGSGARFVVDRETAALTPTTLSQPAACERGDTCRELAPALRRLRMKEPGPRETDIVAGDRLFRVHLGANEEIRILARDLRTRAKLYDVEIAGLGYGSWVEKVRAEGDELYVVANLELYVLDARTGAVTRRLGTL